MVVEVHNTHGERHLYTLRPRDRAPTFVASMEKAFYVSPFIETGGGYTVRVRDEASRLRITINHEQPDGLAPAREPGPGPAPADGPKPRCGCCSGIRS